MKAYIKNLHDHILEPRYSGVIAYCPECEYACSANKGDYWDWPDNEALKCPDCKKILILGKEQTTFIPL